MSLAAQLSQISQSAKAVALDRKSKSKLHSISFLYDRYFAATQDYESIFADSLAAVKKLELLDSRFTKFESTIFSEFSIGIDRETKTKEENKNLDRTINAFLSLVAPYWHLAISVRAAEWPLRRFGMNIYNSEYLLLSTLPYFDQPVFERVLYVIPTLPSMFKWLEGFKKAAKCPTKSTIGRALSDITFFNLYSKYVTRDVQHHTKYSKELVFYVSTTISGIATLSSSESKHLAEYISLALSSASTLLESSDSESKISAYTILAVISSAVPLSKEVVMASIETIIGKSVSQLTFPAFRCILKLYQSIQTDPLAPLPLAMLPAFSRLSKPEWTIFIESSSSNARFVTAYIRASISNTKIETKSILDLLGDSKIELTKEELGLIELDSVEAVKKDSTNADSMALILKAVYELDHQDFIDVLKQKDLALSDLELLLHTTISDTISEPEPEELSDKDEIIAPASKEDLKKQFGSLKVSSLTFISSDPQVNKSFEQLRLAFLGCTKRSKIKLFLSFAFKNIDQCISFLLRVASHLRTPIKARCNALKSLRMKIKMVDETVLLSSIVPTLSTLLLDNSTVIRGLALDVFKSINAKKSLRSKSILLQHIYGDEITATVLSPKDNSQFIANVCENFDVIKLDSDAFIQLLPKISGDKKLARVILAFYASHALAVDIPDIKGKLFKITSAGCSVVQEASCPSEVFSDFLTTYLQKRGGWIQKSIITQSDFNSFEDETIDLIGQKSCTESALRLLEKALSSPIDHLHQSAERRLFDIYPTLPFDLQVNVVNYILEDGLSDEDFSSKYDPVELLESLPISDKVLAQLLKSSLLSSSQQSREAIVKRRRRSSASARQAMKESNVSDMARKHLRKVTILLDVLFHFSSQSTFKPSLSFLRLLFSILDDLESLGMDGKFPVLYAQETLADCMVNIIHSLKEQHVVVKDTLSIRADIIVSSIRSSDTPQVQNKLLLVVASLATFAPELVLHSVMPIFTFMGAHTVRQDDEFSEQVVEETIRRVVPALSSTAKSGLSEEIDFLLASFVSAFPHIPRHRRVKLFTTLAMTLGSEYSIHIILFLCGQQYAESYSKHKMTTCDALVDFSSTFLQVFSPRYQLLAAIKYLDIWKQIPDIPVEKGSKAYNLLTSRIIFGSSIIGMNKSELYNLKRGLVSYLRHSLVAYKNATGIPQLTVSIASEFLKKKDSEADLEVFSKLIRSILDLIDEYKGSVEDEEILKKFYKLLSNVLSFLPLEYFVKSVARILTSETTSTRTKKQVSVLITSKFELEDPENEFIKDGITQLVSILLEIIKSDKDVELCQSAFDTISAFFQQFNNKVESSVLKAALEVAVSNKGLLNTEAPELVVSSINCITSIVLIEGVRIIGYFPKIVPPLQTIFDSFIKSDDKESSQLVDTAVLVLYSALIRKMPNFLIPNIESFVDCVLRASVVSTPIRNTVLSSFVECADAKTMIDSLCKLWSKVATRDPITIGLYLSSMDMEVQKLSRKVAIGQSKVFMGFLLEALEFKGISKFDINTTNRVMAGIFKCAIQYVMKLNDKTFRPLFASVGRWAFDGEGAINKIDEIDRYESFFKFFNKLQENLHGIITSYYSYLLDSTEKLLAKFADDSLQNISLRRFVLISLTSSFKYDTTGYWQVSSRYDPISVSLCDQLVNIEDKIGKNLVKCLTALAQTAGSAERNKSLCTLLMSHMKAECKPREKYWTVCTLKNIYRKLGENWMDLLPQLVPLIAELLEDDDDEVEEEVRTGLAKVIESVMGEPLDRYLE